MSPETPPRSPKNDLRINSDSLLTVFANLFLWPGLIAGLLMIVNALNSYSTNPIGIGIGVLIIVQAVFIYALLKGFADVIRMLKVLAGVEGPAAPVKPEKPADRFDVKVK